MAGVLTRAQIENETLDNLAKSSLMTLQSGDAMSTRVTRWVNRAQQWVARRADLLQGYVTTSTVASQQTYAFPTGMRKVYTLRLMDGLNSRKLDCTMPWEMDRRVPMPAALTTLRSWFYVPYKNTGTFELFPIPDTTYTIYWEYYKNVATDMTTSDLATEIPDIPTQNQDALWKGGLYYFYKMFDDTAQEIAYKDYKEALQALTNSDQNDADALLGFRWGVEFQEPRGANGIRIF